MNQLAQLQQAFQAYVMDEAMLADISFVVNDNKVGAKKRLGIYHDAYRLRIVEALASPYAMLKKLLGDELFNKTARGYLALHPSVYPNLRWYGSDMPDYLRQTLPHHLVAAELAAFEWALGVAFDAADTAVIRLQDLATIPPDQWADLIFVFQPGLQILPFNTNAVMVWKALDAGEAPPKIEQVLDLYWLIWRQYLNSHFRSIDLLEISVLKRAQAGASFGDICAHLQQNIAEDEAIMQAAQYLSAWLEAGLISQLNLKKT